MSKAVAIDKKGKPAKTRNASEVQKPRTQRRISLVGKILRGEVSNDVLRNVAPQSKRYDEPQPMASHMQDRIMTYVRELCGVYNVTEVEILGRTRQAYIAEARHIAWWLCRHRLHLTYAVIARIFQRDHVTIMHGVGRIDGYIASDPEYAAYMRRLGSWIDEAQTAIGDDSAPDDYAVGHS